MNDNPIYEQIENFKSLIKEWGIDYKNELYQTHNPQWEDFSTVIHSEHLYLKYYKKYYDHLDILYPIDYKSHPVLGVEPKEVDMNFVNRFLLKRGVKDDILSFDIIRDNFENR